MAVSCPFCRSTDTQSLMDRYQCLSVAGHEFFPDGSFAPSDAYPTAPPPAASVPAVSASVADVNR